MANVEAQTNAVVTPTSDDAEFQKHGCRLSYSSVLAAHSHEEAQTLLAQIFTIALLRNPEKEIGGMLFYDEKTNAIVQVLEGPAPAVRDLFYKKIEGDSRHTAVKVLWDVDVEARRFEGFGMKLGNNQEDVLKAAQSDQQELLKLSYVSQLTAASRDAAYEDIQAILRCAIVTNPKLHIGGALFLNPRTLHVLQVLEGPQRAVKTLYDKIALDKRHTACKVLSEQAVQEREYSQWGMLQGEPKDADWSCLQGWNNPKRRRGRDNVGEGIDGQDDLQSRMKEAEARAAEAELRASQMEAKLAEVKGAAEAKAAEGGGGDVIMVESGDVGETLPTVVAVGTE